MNHTLMVATSIVVLYAIFRFLEIRYWDKNYPPVKYVVRELIKVFLCSWICVAVFGKFDGQISDFFSVIMDKKVLDPTSVNVFTDEPNF